MENFELYSALVGVVFSVGFAIYKTIKEKGERKLLETVILGIEHAKDYVDIDQLKVVKDSVNHEAKWFKVVDKLHKIVKAVTAEEEEKEGKENALEK